MRSTGSHEFLTVIPEGDWRTVEYGGAVRRLSLRRHVIHTFHLTPMGPHRGRDKTVQAIMDAGCWWFRLYQDVQEYVRLCVICRSVNDSPLVTGHQRSREYDGPFRYLLIDFVGPITPPSARGHRFMFTCCCAWSGWYWAFPTKDSSQETAAHYLFHYVICDLAGYPVCLGSDGAWSFVTGVVQSLIKLFNVVHIIGSAYHPQSQGAVERPHREYNKICKSFMAEYSDWDLVVSIFVWSIRTSTKLYNGTYTPYEIVTGMKPRSPIDAVLSMNVTPERISYDKYVTDLVRYLKEVHRHVDEQHVRVHDQQNKAKLRELGVGQSLAVGDYCLVQRPPTPGISVRLQSKHHSEIYQMMEDRRQRG